MLNHVRYPEHYLHSVILDVVMAGSSAQVCGMQIACPLLKAHHLGLVQGHGSCDYQLATLLLQVWVILETNSPRVKCSHSSSLGTDICTAAGPGHSAAIQDRYVVNVVVNAHHNCLVRYPIDQWVAPHANIEVSVTEPLYCFIHIGHCAQRNLE